MTHMTLRPHCFNTFQSRHGDGCPHPGRRETFLGFCHSILNGTGAPPAHNQAGKVTRDIKDLQQQLTQLAKDWDAEATAEEREILDEELQDVVPVFGFCGRTVGFEASGARLLESFKFFVCSSGPPVTRKGLQEALASARAPAALRLKRLMIGCTKDLGPPSPSRPSQTNRFSSFSSAELRRRPSS